MKIKQWARYEARRIVGYVEHKDGKRVPIIYEPHLDFSRYPPAKLRELRREAKNAKGEPRR